MGSTTELDFARYGATPGEVGKDVEIAVPAFEPFPGHGMLLRDRLDGRDSCLWEPAHMRMIAVALEQRLERVRATRDFAGCRFEEARCSDDVTAQQGVSDIGGRTT